jgi:hypothetical protein
MILALLLLLSAPAFAQKVHELCRACHTEQFEDFQSHPHFSKGLSCDACHGGSAAHRAANGAAPPDQVAAPDQQPALCGACHPAPAKAYSASAHGKLVLARAGKKAASCTVCHGIHSLRTAVQMKAQCERCHAQLVPGHPKFAAQTLCAACHSGHSLSAKK